MILKITIDNYFASTIKHNLGDYVRNGDGLIIKIDASNGLICPDNLSNAMEEIIKTIILQLVVTDTIQ